MESNRKDGMVLFAGNVEARQGQMLISSAEMKVKYGQGTNKSIEGLIATGSVKVTRKDWIATGDQLEYESAERKVILTGNTKVWQDNNMVTGDRVVLYLDEGKSVVENKEETGQIRTLSHF